VSIGLNENDIGHDREIWYPNLRTCLSLTLVLDDGTMLGTHMTAATTMTQIEMIAGYFAEQRGEAEVLCMLLIGNIDSWRVHDEEPLRTGGNLRATLRDFLGTDCVIYQYDSARAKSGGRGAAVHLIHTGGAFPYVGLLQEGDWSNFLSMDRNSSAFAKLTARRKVQRVVEATPWGRDAGAPHGVCDPKAIVMIRATGSEKPVRQRDMKIT
jgi:hypothetical protein